MDELMNITGKKIDFVFESKDRWDSFNHEVNSLAATFTKWEGGKNKIPADMLTAKNKMADLVISRYVQEYELHAYDTNRSQDTEEKKLEYVTDALCELLKVVEYPREDGSVVYGFKYDPEHEKHAKFITVFLQSARYARYNAFAKTPEGKRIKSIKDSIRNWNKTHPEEQISFDVHIMSNKQENIKSSAQHKKIRELRRQYEEVKTLSIDVGGLENVVGVRDAMQKASSMENLAAVLYEREQAFLRSATTVNKVKEYLVYRAASTFDVLEKLRWTDELYRDALVEHGDFLWKYMDVTYDSLRDIKEKWKALKTEKSIAGPFESYGFAEFNIEPPLDDMWNMAYNDISTDENGKPVLTNSQPAALKRYFNFTNPTTNIETYKELSKSFLKKAREAINKD